MLILLVFLGKCEKSNDINGCIAKSDRLLGKKLNGVEATVATPVAGKIPEVHYIYAVSSLERHEKLVAEVAQNDEFKKIGAGIAPIVVPNTA